MQASRYGSCPTSTARTWWQSLTELTPPQRFSSSRGGEHAQRGGAGQAVQRCATPRNRSLPSAICAGVAPQAAMSSNNAGKYGPRTRRYWVYASQFHRATLLVSAAPHRPNQSATADTNPAPYANRTNIVDVGHTWALAAARLSPTHGVPISVALLVSSGK